jgi:hypothetical protein
MEASGSGGGGFSDPILWIIIVTSQFAVFRIGVEAAATCDAKEEAK